MIRFYLLLIAISSVYITYSQERINDLVKLDEILRSTPSFKAQIKDEKKIKYESVYRELKEHINDSMPDMDHYILLSKLVRQVKDVHINLHIRFTDFLDYARLQDTAYVNDFKRKYYSLPHPAVNFNLDSLKKVLTTKNKDEIEGIYYFQRAMVVGVFRTDSNTFKGVVLESYLPLWKPGEICLILEEQSSNSFYAHEYSPFFKTYRFVLNEKFIGGDLSEYGISKLFNQKNHALIADSIPKFYSYLINDSTRYIRLGSFNMDEQNKKRSTDFFNQIKDSIVQQNIVLDLRNNGGGYFGVSRPYLTFFQKYSKEHTIKLLVNRNTVSNAEQFVIRLKEYKNVTVYGEDTRGMITYGSNYGKFVPLHSDYLTVYPTDMSGSTMDLEYEIVGVKPAIYLKRDSDWVKQVVELR